MTRSMKQTGLMLGLERRFTVNYPVESADSDLFSFFLDTSHIYARLAHPIYRDNRHSSRNPVVNRSGMSHSPSRIMTLLYGADGG